MTKSTIMKHEIWKVSNYRTLIFTTYYMSFYLIICTLYNGYMGYALSPFYILILLHIMPPILSHIIINISAQSNSIWFKNPLKNNPFLLTSLQRKYNFNKQDYIIRSFNFYFILFLIILWQINYRSSTLFYQWYSFAPGVLLGSLVLLRILGTLIYYVKIHYTLTHNKL